MELKEYIQIIKKNSRLFLGIIFATIAIAILYFYLQPVSYETSLMLNITRTGSQETTDYRYDDFYRLQADERFADTVAQWLRNSQIVANIFASAKKDTSDFSLAKLSKSLLAQRKSSQIVEVNFSSASKEDAQKISAGIIKAVSQITEKLNANQKESYWFQIMAEDPITLQKITNYKIIFFASLLAGIFLAFWVVMLKYYLE